MNPTQSTSMKISLIYTAQFENKDGIYLPFYDEPIETNFTTGKGEKFKAFETKILMLKKDDKFAFTLSSVDTYGEYIDEYEHQIASINAIKNLSGKETLQCGLLRFKNGQFAVINEVLGDIVDINLNHPFAGHNIYYEGEIIDIETAGL